VHRQGQVGCSLLEDFQTDRSRWSRGLRRRFAACRLLGVWVRIPPAYGFLFHVNLACFLVEVSATGRSLAQSPTEGPCVSSGITITLYTYNEVINMSD